MNPFASARSPLRGIVGIVGGCLITAACASTPVRESPASTAPSSTATSAVTASVSPSLAASPSGVASPSSASTEPFSPFGSLPNKTLDPTRTAALQAILDRSIKDGAPDMIAAVITPDGTWSGAAGHGGPNDRMASARDEFYIASLSKVFTAALTLRLVEEGRMQLDSPLADYLGDLKADTNHATVRQFLAMTSGLPDYPDTAGEEIRADPRRVWTPEELIQHFAPVTASPGETYQYGNPGYVLLALAIEHVTGTSFAKALQAGILAPAGTTRVVDQVVGTPTPKPWAIPFGAHGSPFVDADYGRDGVISCASSVTFSLGGGSMASDAPSLVALTWRLFNGELIARDSVAAMLPVDNSDHGLGLERLTFLGGTAIFGQTGQKTGYGSTLAVMPANRAIVAVFVNDVDFNYDAYTEELLRAAA